MSVIVTLRVKGDPNQLEQRAAGDPDGMRSLADRAKQRGVIAHRFYGSEEGDIMVVDEWPDQESFRSFFQESQSEIEPMMRDIGATSEPEVRFWRKLDSRDEIGWES